MNDNSPTFKVLVVEDSATSRHLLVHILRQQGYDVETADNGLEALDKLSQESFDLVLLDIFMPLMDGRETLQIIRSHPDTADLSVAMISGQSDKEVVQEVAKLGIIDYIVKPFDSTTVTKRLNRIFTKMKSQARLSGATKTSTSDKRAMLLIADQDANFRHFFVTTLSTKFRVFEAINGAEAFMKVMQYQPDALFVGAELGMLSQEKLVRKIRNVKNLRTLKIYAITRKDTREPLPAVSLYNGEIAHSFVPNVLLKCLDELFPSKSVTAEDITRFTPLLQTSLVSAAEEVFGMMMSTEITGTLTPRNLDPSTPMAYTAVTLISHVEKLQATVIVKCERACVVKMAARMLNIEEDEADDAEMIVATLSEVVNVIGGRVKAALGEKIVDFTLGLPIVKEHSASELSDPHASTLSRHFVTGEDLRVSVFLLAESLPQADLQQETKPAETVSSGPDEP